MPEADEVAPRTRYHYMNVSSGIHSSQPVLRAGGRTSSTDLPVRSPRMSRRR